MRPKCACGKVPGYYYAPVIYKKMTYEEHIAAHVLCADCADTENWAEYEYIGFHKKDWQWLTKKNQQATVDRWNEWLSLPYYDVSHIKDGKRWYYGRYRDLDEMNEAVKGLVGVEIKEGYYE